MYHRCSPIKCSAYLAPSVSWCLAKGFIAVNYGVVNDLSIRQYETWVGWKKNITFYSGLRIATRSFYFMIKLSYMNDLARNWKYRVRGIIHKLENKYIKPGLLHFWLLTFLWHFYKMTMLLWLLSNLNLSGGVYRPHDVGVMDTFQLILPTLPTIDIDKLHFWPDDIHYPVL